MIAFFFRSIILLKIMMYRIIKLDCTYLYTIFFQTMKWRFILLIFYKIWKSRNVLNTK